MIFGIMDSEGRLYTQQQMTNTPKTELGAEAAHYEEKLRSLARAFNGPGESAGDGEPVKEHMCWKAADLITRQAARVKELEAQFAALQPRPISEAPRDGRTLLMKTSWNSYMLARWGMTEPDDCDDIEGWIIAQTKKVTDEKFTHFYDLSALPKPEKAE